MTRSVASWPMPSMIGGRSEVWVTEAPAIRTPKSALSSGRGWCAESDVKRTLAHNV